MRVLRALIFIQLAQSFRVAKKNADESNETASSEKACVEFMIIGDFGSKKTAQGRVRDSMAAEASKVNAAAILALGDNIYENGASSESQMVRDWKDIWLKRSGNRRPWYAVMGNHDWRSDGNIMRKFTSSSKNGGYWKMPTFWHKKRFGNVEVFFVDTYVWRGSVKSMRSKISEQKRWLENGLSSSSAAWKIVAGHHPVYSVGSHGGDSTAKRELDPIMRKYGANIYFAGHDHSQQHISYRNVNYVVAGAGSKSPRGKSNDYPSGSLKKYQGEEGFAGLRICDDSKATLKLFKASGSVFYQTTLQNSRPGAPSPPGPSPPSPPSETRRRRRRRVALAESTEAGEGEVIDKMDMDDVHESEPYGEAFAFCNGAKLEPIDARCSRDGCTVQPDTDSSKISCDRYCADNGLSCSGAWVNEYEDCGLDQEVACDSLVTGSGAQVCQCT